jgi:hypothetical protein
VNARAQTLLAFGAVRGRVWTLVRVETPPSTATPALRLRTTMELEGSLYLGRSVDAVYFPQDE